MNKNQTLLFLDDIRNPFENDWLNFSPIKHPYEIIWIKSYSAFVTYITNFGLPTAICFDHDLGLNDHIERVQDGMSKRKSRRLKSTYKTGHDCAKWLVEYCFERNLELPKWNIQSSNPIGKINIDSVLTQYTNYYNKLNGIEQ